MDRRKFLKLMGGVASLPVIGSLGKGTQKAKKGIVAAGQAAKMTETQSILPDLIATVMKKGKEFDTGMPNSIGKKYRGVEVVEDSGEVYVKFETDMGNKAFARVEKADYVVDEKTGKSVYKPPEYDEGQEIMKGPDDIDVEYEILDNISGLRAIAMEGKISEKVKDVAGRIAKRESKSGGGIAGAPPVYQTNDSKEALKEIIRRTPFLGGTGEVLPIYSNENMDIETYLGSPRDNVSYGLGAFTNRGDIMLNQLRSGDKQIGYEFGTTATPNTTFGLGYTEGQGPRFGLQYERRFAEGGVASGPPPERGPNPQGLETLFQTR